MKVAVSVALLLTMAAYAVTAPVPSQQPCASSLADCPDTGCSTGDPNLNRLKNRSTEPEQDVIQTRTLSQMRQFNQPASWTSGQERSSLAFREEKAVVVKAFLRDVRASGKETTNCKLSGRDNNDFHLDLVSSKNAIKATSVTAEITPRFRLEGWDFDKLKQLSEEKYYVRITGWFLLDTAHINNQIIRSTNWEIHPVTKVEVCTLTKAKCDRGEGWELLEDVVIE